MSLSISNTLLLTLAFDQKYGFGRHELLTLLFLDEHGSATPSQIKEYTRCLSAQVSRVVSKLENAGLVKRTVGIEDKRHFNFALTSKGKSIVTEIEREAFNES